MTSWKTWLVAGSWLMSAGFVGLSGEALAQTVCVTSAGAPPTAIGGAGFACGDSAFAYGGGTTSVGSFAGEGTSTTSGENTAIGAFAGQDYNGFANSAVGYGAGGSVNGSYNSALGHMAGRHLNGSNNVAIGTDAGSGSLFGDLNVSRTVAIGSSSIASQNDAIAVGFQARAEHVNAIAIGSGVQTTRDNQVKIGTDANTYTLGGLTTAASRAAQNGGNAALPTYFVSTDMDGNLASSSFSLQQVEQTMSIVAGHTTQLSSHATQLSAHSTQLASHTSQIASLDGRVSALEASVGGEIAATRTEARQGIAASIAMSSAPMPSTVGKTSWAMNVGYFKGETAVGGSLTHRFDTAIPLGLTLGYSYGGGNSHAARLGLMGEF